MKKHIQNERGESIIEYILILAIIPIIIAMVFPLMKDFMGKAVDNTQEALVQEEKQAEKTTTVAETPKEEIKTVAKDESIGSSDFVFEGKKENNFGEKLLPILLVLGGLGALGFLLFALVKTLKTKEESKEIVKETVDFVQGVQLKKEPIEEKEELQKKNHQHKKNKKKKK